jgi:hypothetical protein
MNSEYIVFLQRNQPWLLNLYNTWLTHETYAVWMDAKRTLQRIAQYARITLDEMIEFTVPATPPDITYEWGAQTFRLALETGLRASLRDKHGRRHETLPDKPRRLPAAEAQAIRTAWQIEQAKLISLQLVQAIGLEQALIEQRRWSTETFREKYWQHPIMGYQAQTLVWGTFDEQDQLLAAFHITADLTLETNDYASITLPDDAIIGIVHPLYIAADERRVWRQVFYDDQLIQPFQQLDRPIWTLDKLERTPLGEIIVPLNESLGERESSYRRWHQQMIASARHTQGFHYQFRRVALEVILRFEYTDNGTAAYVSFQRMADGQPLDPGEVTPALISETLYAFFTYENHVL